MCISYYYTDVDTSKSMTSGYSDFGRKIGDCVEKVKLKIRKIIDRLVSIR